MTDNNVSLNTASRQALRTLLTQAWQRQEFLERRLYQLQKELKNIQNCIVAIQSVAAQTVAGLDTMQSFVSEVICVSQSYSIFLCFVLSFFFIFFFGFQIANDDEQNEDDVDSRQTTLSLPPTFTDIVQRQPRGTHDYVCLIFFHCCDMFSLLFPYMFF